MPATVFCFGAFEAGAFDIEPPPREPGRYRYTPIEGPGHDELQAMRRNGGQPRCHYDAGDCRVAFTVQLCPRYGLLELVDFETSPVPTH